MDIDTAKDIGTLIRARRRQQKLTQTDLAGVSGTGLRFIVDIEKGKETAQIGKLLRVLRVLGLKVQVS